MTSPHCGIEILRPVSSEEDTPDMPNELIDEPDTWWLRYASSLASLPSDTQAVIEDDASHIARLAMPMVNGILNRNAFDSTRTRTGIVVGSVQSGKTASMLAVAALLLDQGVELLILLAGTRVGLWLQTYERLLNQLDASTVTDAWVRNKQRTLIPQPEDILRDSDRIDPTSYLQGARLKFKQGLTNKKPIIFVVPKEDDHLLALSRFLQKELTGVRMQDPNQCLRMVVLDDEADDASILDSGEGSRITPKFIQQLWSGDRSAPATHSPNLFATYVAYTATPQANYLQQSHNPLAPRDFHCALRVPSDNGARTPRSVSYREKKGIVAYYCGGELFYERLRNLAGDPCVPYPFPLPNEEADGAANYDNVRWQMIGDALRSFFVAGAIRLLIDDRKLSDVPSDPVQRELLETVLPKTHSMLYHPSALKTDHFEGAEDVARWCQSIPGEEKGSALPRSKSGELLFEISDEGLRRRLELEEDQWRTQMTSFFATAAALSSIPGGNAFSSAGIDWPSVRELLVNEVFPNVQLRVLNSDPRADDRPCFSPRRSDVNPDLWHAPRDLYTIFVAGNILSRGLTVEGLCTSLFMRAAREPAADTQMQMQRWFGYRGRHLPFCRVFLFADQLQLFRQYHANDIALKTEILNHMDGSAAPFADGVLVLAGDRFQPTAKIDSRKLPLHPGPAPAIRLFEPSTDAAYGTNIALIQRQLDDKTWDYLKFPSDAVRGLISTEPLSLLEVAALLEGLRYSHHDPALTLDLSRRWSNLQLLLNVREPLFNPPGIHPGPMEVDPSGCPYSIAAYLRLWDLALRRNDLPGMHPTDNPEMPWNMLNLSDYRKSAPKFNLGIRFGSSDRTKTLKYKGAGFPMMIRGTSRGRPYLLDALWGSRNPTESWRGDPAFDYHYTDPERAPRILEHGAWRRRGEPGLLLIHPVVDCVTGLETIAIGLILPHGGPDHIAALRVKRVANE